MSESERSRGMEELEGYSSFEEVRLSRLVFLRGKLAEAAKQLEHWRQTEERIYRLIQTLEGQADE